MVLAAVTTMSTPQAFAGMMLDDRTSGGTCRTGMMLDDRAGGTCRVGLTSSALAIISARTALGMMLDD
ncbi:MAG TPA: hypothetical protein VF708_15880 [Pyrinomonadaceae bacterium]